MRLEIPGIDTSEGRYHVERPYDLSLFRVPTDKAEVTGEERALSDAEAG